MKKQNIDNYCNIILYNNDFSLLSLLVVSVVLNFRAVDEVLTFGYLESQVTENDVVGSQVMGS